MACSVNAALASINRSIFINASVADKAAIDSLENALNVSYSSEANTEVIARSNTFGKAVADAVFNWSATDGIAHVSDAYTPPVGPGYGFLRICICKSKYTLFWKFKAYNYWQY